MQKNASIVQRVDDTPVDGVTKRGISSNWAFDHAADLDAHIHSYAEIHRTGQYHCSYPAENWQLTDDPGADTLWGVPLWVPRATTFDRIAIRFSAAAAGGKKARLGIYNDGTNLYPGTLILDGGEIAADGTGIVAATISQSLTKGLYWLAFITDGTPTLGVKRLAWSPLGLSEADTFQLSMAAWEASLTYAALPATFTAGGSLAWKSPNIALRVLSLD